MTYLAHSAQDKIPEQSYYAHVVNVKERALHNVQSLLPFYNGDVEKLCDTIGIAAELHDLGKLSSDNQAVLWGEMKRKSLPINHVDAGTKLLLASGDYQTFIGAKDSINLP